jgi:hypothetical protein
MWIPSVTVIIEVVLIPLYNPWEGPMFPMCIQFL